jgi:hypothetical protein
MVLVVPRYRGGMVLYYAECIVLYSNGLVVGLEGVTGRLLQDDEAVY